VRCVLDRGFDKGSIRVPKRSFSLYSLRSVPLISVIYDCPYLFHGGNTGSNPVGDAKHNILFACASLSSFSELPFTSRVGSLGSLHLALRSTPPDTTEIRVFAAVYVLRKMDCPQPDLGSRTVSSRSRRQRKEWIAASACCKNKSHPQSHAVVPDVQVSTMY